MVLDRIFRKFFQKADNKELVTNSMLAMIFKIGGMLSGYIFIILSIRFTSLEQYGIFSIGLAFIQCCAIVARLGFDSSIVKYVSLYTVNPDDKPIVKEVYLKGLLLISIAGLVLSVIIFFGSTYIATYIFNNKSLTIPLKISACGIFPSIYLYYNSGALRGLKKILHFSVLFNANFISAILVLVVIVFVFDTPYPLELSYSIGTFIIAALSFYWWFRYSNIQFHKSTDQIKTIEILNTTLPMLSAGALYIINGWTDTLFLGMFSTQESVGIFNVLLKIAAITHTVLFAVNAISAPQFARLNGTENRQQLENLVQKSNKLIVITTLPVLVLLMLCYVPLVKLFNVGFKPEAYLLAFIFLCVGQAINSFCGSCSHLLIMTGYQKINRNIIFASVIVSIIFNLLLIPNYGLLGAAFSNMMGLVVRNVLFVIYTNRSLQINSIYNPYADLLKLFKKALKARSVPSNLN